jgi:hypothetical protein
MEASAWSYLSAGTFPASPRKVQSYASQQWMRDDPGRNVTAKLKNQTPMGRRPEGVTMLRKGDIDLERAQLHVRSGIWP